MKSQTLFEYIQEQSIILNRSLREIAKDSDVSYTTLYHLKHRAPSRKTYNKLAEYFDIDIRELIKYPITHK